MFALWPNCAFFSYGWLLCWDNLSLVTVRKDLWSIWRAYQHFLVIRQIDKVEQSSLAEEPLIFLHPESESAYKSAPYTLWAYIAKGFMVRPRRRVCLVEGPGDTDSFRKVQGLLPHHQPAILEGLDLTFHREISAESPIIYWKWFRTLAFGSQSGRPFGLTVRAHRSCQVGATGKTCCCDATFLPLRGERSH